VPFLKGEIMATYFLGQVVPFAFLFSPKGMAACNGQLMMLSQNVPLFSLLGIAYGGDGHTTFALPDLQGRVPVGAGQSYECGQSAGVESVVLQTSMLPGHNHIGTATTQGASVRNPNDNYYATNVVEALYGPATGTQVPLSPATLSSVGSGLAHENMQPFNVVNFCIALSGIFPQHN
jgi:microcystin-dependent protein